MLNFAHAQQACRLEGLLYNTVVSCHDLPLQCLIWQQDYAPWLTWQADLSQMWRG